MSTQKRVLQNANYRAVFIFERFLGIAPFFLTKVFGTSTVSLATALGIATSFLLHFFNYAQ